MPSPFTKGAIIRPSCKDGRRNNTATIREVGKGIDRPFLIYTDLNQLILRLELPITAGPVAVGLDKVGLLFQVQVALVDVSGSCRRCRRRRRRRGEESLLGLGLHRLVFMAGELHLGQCGGRRGRGGRRKRRRDGERVVTARHAGLALKSQERDA